MYNAGQIEELKAYCLSDVVQTAFVFLRYKLLVGAIDKSIYRNAARGLWESLATDGRFGKLIEHTDRERLLLESESNE